VRVKVEEGRVVEGHLVRGHVAGDGQALRLGFPHQLHGPGRGEAGEVQFAAA
jgi:hypothetical protein